MIKVENQYSKMHDYLTATEWRSTYQLDKFLLPALELQAHSFRDGALTQLMACIADLRIWAMQFRALGKQEIAQELEHFADEWENEWPV